MGRSHKDGEKCHRFRIKAFRFSSAPSAMNLMVYLSASVCSSSHGYRFVFEERKYCDSGDVQVMEATDLLKIFGFMQSPPCLVGETGILSLEGQVH